MTIKEFESKLEPSHNKLWAHHAAVPPYITNYFLDVGTKRVVATINGCEPFQCALTAYKKGTYVIKVNQKLKKNLGLIVGETVKITLEKDESEYGLPFPDALREVLLQDPEGEKFFNTLTKGKQRTLLYIINQGKSQDRQVIRSVIVIEHLKQYKGKIDYKVLNQAIRNAQ